MRILFITEFFPDFDKKVFTGGVETRTFYTSLYLSLHNKVWVISRRKNGQKSKEIKGNLTLLRLNPSTNDSSATFSSFFGRLIFIFSAFFKSLKLNIDIVEGSNFVAFIPAFFIGFFKKIPKIAWYPDVLIGHWQKEFGFLVGGIGEVGERFFFKLPWDKIVTISPAVKERLTKFGVDKRKIEVIFCGVDKTVFKPSKKFKQKTLCVVSRLLSYKRIEDAIKAMFLINNNFDVRFKIVGSGPEKENLLRLIKEIKLTKKVKFYEKITQTELIRIISKSHLLIHPSVIEGFGIVLVEGASCGTPFIAADIPTSRLLRNKLESGLLFEEGNIKDLASKTMKVLQDKRLYDRLRRNGIKKSSKFSWEILTKETEKIFIEEGRTPLRVRP